MQSRSQNVIAVCPSGCNFTSVQDAINHASDGDTIEVMNGSYNEVIDINKSVNVIGIAGSGDISASRPVYNAGHGHYQCPGCNI